MESVVAYLPALACVAMMLLICVPMLLGRKHNQASDESASQQEVAQLREEVSRLRSERESTDRSEKLDV
ncbi:MAG: hypothetical protein ACRDKF_03370 [Actinomycetota bacterium]